MKRKHMKIFYCLATAFIFFLSSCGADCKKCHAEVLGVATPAQELCGEQLEQALKTPGMVCK